jgi:hypothetical protein
MDANADTVSARVYTGWTVPIERTGPTSAIFRGPIRLYRTLDSFERDALADAVAASPDAVFSGGVYNIAEERVGGAAFGTLPLDVLRFERRGSRLKPPLYLVEVEGEDLPFVRLLLDAAVNDGAVYAIAGNSGLGFNVRPRVRSVLRAWSVDPQTRAIHPIDWRALLDAHRTGTTARVIDAIRAYDAGWEYFYGLLDAERNAERADPWFDPKRFWTPARKGEARRELAAWADAIATISAVLPDYTGLDTYKDNVINRLPADLQRAFTSALSTARRK